MTNTTAVQAKPLLDAALMLCGSNLDPSHLHGLGFQCWLQIKSEWWKDIYIARDCSRVRGDEDQSACLNESAVPAVD